MEANDSLPHMQKEVQEAIENGIKVRKEVLGNLGYHQKVALLELLFKDFFDGQHRMLQKWAALTGQTAQVDTGYISQFIASIVTGVPGQGFRGKGDDLVDGSEVKSAANISGVDRPRWNHNLGKVSEDKVRRQKNEKTTGDQYLDSPYLFYVLVDRAAPHQHSGVQPMRIRAWCVNVQEDKDWRDLVNKFLESRSGNKYNFQLHPPVGHDDDLVVNTLGNLDFSEILVFDYRLTPQKDGTHEGHWHAPLPDPFFPVMGRTIAKPYGGRNARKSNYTAPEDLVADVAILPDRFPGILGKRAEDRIDQAAEDELQAEAKES